MLGPVQRASKLMERGLDQLTEQEQAQADFLVEESMMEREPRFSVRVTQEKGLLLLLDTSLSIKGEKLAILGMTVAVLSQMLKAHEFSIIGFDSSIHRIKSFSEQGEAFEWVKRVMSIPPGGLTHFEKGLKAAEEEIKKSRFPEARVIVVSDGRVTEGIYPVSLGSRFHAIYPFVLGRDPAGRMMMTELADQTRGRVVEVREMTELPRILMRGVRAWLRS